MTRVRHRVLVIEPDPQLASVMRRSLSGTFDLTVVTTAASAIAELRRASPDLIVTELRLPDLGPVELYAIIEGETPHLTRRTLFLTGGFVPEPVRQLLARLPGQWLTKPFSLAQLRATIDALLER